MTEDVVVVGDGIGGCLAALVVARERPAASVRLLAFQEGRFDYHPGLVDVLGYTPAADTPVENPFDAIESVPPDHPYRQVGSETLREGLAVFDEQFPYRGGHTESNALVATANGRLRPTARYPPGVAAGLASEDEPILLVGFEEVPDLDASLAAGRLDERLPYSVEGVSIEFPTSVSEYPATPALAAALDDNEPLDGGASSGGVLVEGTTVREALAERVWSDLDVEPRVGFPAVLGRQESAAVRRDLAERLHVDVFEIPTGPPSIPGRRLRDRLHEALTGAGVELTTGQVTGFDAGDRIERILTDDGTVEPRRVVLATGGVGAGGLVGNHEEVHEPVFDCHVDHTDRAEWTAPAVLGDHQFARFGLTVDDTLRPLTAGGDPEYGNLHAVGRVLGGVDYVAEQSGDGVGIATGYAVGRHVAELL